MTPQVPPYRRGGGFGSLGVRFSEVIEPPPISLAPTTIGAWFTLGALVVLLATGLTWLTLHHVRRRHRRVARRELDALAHARKSGSSVAVLETLPSVLKRCALASFSRVTVAPLSGERWRQFLDESCPGAPFAGSAGQALVTLTTRGASALGQAEESALFAASLTWVRRHRARI